MLEEDVKKNLKSRKSLKNQKESPKHESVDNKIAQITATSYFLFNMTFYNKSLIYIKHLKP